MISLSSTFDLGKFIFELDINDLLDSRDFQLFVALYGNARQSYASLGRRVSLSAPAVRERLNRFKSKGILQGFM
jgi:DNA-binding Lrp family transcriptional regulator